jgi:hypothetical protein
MLRNPMKALEKNHPTQTEDPEENPLPDMTPELQAMADEMAAAMAVMQERHRQNPISLEEARAQVPEELRARSPLKNA